MPCKIDCQACKDPEKIDMFRQRLQRLPISAWSMDIDLHATWQREAICTIAEEV